MLLLKKVPEKAVVVALDEKGEKLTSKLFADKFMSGGSENRGIVAFLIGGSDGLDPVIIDRADFVLSLGAQTWPHMLVRGLLVEQIYRSQCINSGHPYHKK